MMVVLQLWAGYSANRPAENLRRKPFLRQAKSAFNRTQQQCGQSFLFNFFSLTLEQQQSKKRLIQQLSARLIRDKQLQYTAREFEMQRLLMGRGARRKLKGIETVESGKNEDREDDDEADARKGKRKITAVNEKLYKPRVYKWRQERKR
jgi:hypothetical protein